MRLLRGLDNIIVDKAVELKPLRFDSPININRGYWTIVVMCYRFDRLFYVDSEQSFSDINSNKATF